MPDLPPHTHLAIDRTLCGEPLELTPGRSRVVLVTRPEMAADERGLVHGGFVFGLADYAAMLAVDHPNVVLGAAEVRFLAPCVTGDRLVAEGKVVEGGVEVEGEVEVEAGGKKTVRVEVRRDASLLFTGTFTCFVLPNHVLEGAR